MPELCTQPDADIFISIVTAMSLPVLVSQLLETRSRTPRNSRDNGFSKPPAPASSSGSDTHTIECKRQCTFVGYRQYRNCGCAQQTHTLVCRGTIISCSAICLSRIQFGLLKNHTFRFLVFRERYLRSLWPKFMSSGVKPFRSFKTSATIVHTFATCANYRSS